ncbi:MAG: hypothetical protein PF450_13835 [Bacteroidales bacterium]|nr:hypothetical protein [Bacteroidales bacterium]
MSILYKNHALYPDKILIREFEGEVSIEKIIDSWENLVASGLITGKTRGIINNISACELQMDMGGLEKLIDFLHGNKVLSKLNLAVICTDPLKIVFPIMGESNKKGLGIKTFSTMEAAENWILNYPV